ncbi:MAG: permease, partial [Nannocystaceae bacterium]|nr:permease [Nannocystaceae bacterium]
MIVALLVTAAAVIAGGGLAVVTSRDNVLVGGLQSFGAAAVVAAVVVQLLPEAVAGIGSWALVAFIGALAAPMFVAALSTKLRRASLFGQQNFGAELAFYGFVVHQWAEGVALGTVTAQEHGHSHLDLVIGIAAHTVPITAVFVAAALASRGRRSAALRTATLLAATLAGFVTVALFEGQSLQTIQPWVSAAAAGFLVHVLLHAPERNSGRGSVAGSVDVLGLALGATLPFIVGHAHSAKGDIVVQVRADLGVAFVDLMLATAPMLLLGLVLGAVVQLFGSRIPTRFFTERGPVRQALRGIAVGTPLPLCACTLLPVAESLRRRGGGPAVVTAFLTATPAMGPEMVTLTVLLFGGTFTLVRFGAALLLAFLCAVVLALLAGRPELASPSSAPSVDPLAQLGERAEPPPTLTRVYGFFDALLLHTGPWMLVGLVAAAYVQVVVPAGAFAEAAGYGLDAVIIGVLALPAYVCAVAATPLAAVALL